MIMSSQLRAGRAILGWSQDDLAGSSGVSKPTIARLELTAGAIGGYAGTREKLVAALEAAGIEFIPENGGGAGVRLKRPAASAAKIEALEDKIASIPDHEEPSPQAGMDTMRKAVAENELAHLKGEADKDSDPD